MKIYARQNFFCDLYERDAVNNSSIWYAVISVWPFNEAKERLKCFVEIDLFFLKY